MRFVIYGSGAIGGVLGARLYESGQEVMLIARGPHLDRLRSDGLCLEDDQGTRLLRIPVVEHPRDAGVRSEDVVVLALKAQHTAQALETLGPVTPPGTAVLCAQNGIDNERQALRRFPNVYGAYVSCLATHLRPGAVQAHSSPVTGTVDVGRYPRGIDARAEQLAACLRVARFDSEVQPDIMSWKREKLLVNLATTVEAVCGPDARSGQLASLVREEGEAVLASSGLSRPSAARIQDRQALATCVAVPRGGGSSWQSLMRGAGSIESDFINGEIVLLGRLNGVATPANELVQRWATRLAAEGRQPGSVAEHDLLFALGAPL